MAECRPPLSIPLPPSPLRCDDRRSVQDGRPTEYGNCTDCRGARRLLKPDVNHCAYCRRDGHEHSGPWPKGRASYAYEVSALRLHN